MWLINSSIGRKVVMSVTGIALILFMTFHCCMNVAALFSKDAYNMICELLGANWYAVANRYEVTAKPDKVEWASQNMLVLGIIVLLGIGLHLFNFWYNMMFAELVGMKTVLEPTDGFGLIVATFKNKLYVVLYIIWIVALWFHLSHGFWSAMQTVGVNGKVWFNRWKIIGNVYVTLLMLAFLVVVLAFAFGCAPSLCCATSHCVAL